MRNLMRWSALVVVVVGWPAQLRAQRSRSAASAALQDSLVRIVLDFYAGWEPQAGTVERAIARGREYFVTDSTFAMIIDTTYRSAFAQWSDRTAVSIPATYKEYQEQRHYITAAKTLPLGRDAAALTIRYCAESLRRDGVQVIANSGATLVFVRRAQGWRIAHYHGSHGPEVVSNAKCPR